MKIGIIAEGPDDIEVVMQVVKKIKDIDTSDMIRLRPSEKLDETDNEAAKFSNWELVLQEAKEGKLLGQFLEEWSDAVPVVVFHIDTAERGEVNYNVTEPVRAGNLDYAAYSEELRQKVKEKFDSLIADDYRDKVVYAIAIEETEAWLIPLFEPNKKGDTAGHAKPKEYLERLLSKDPKLQRIYIDTNKKRLDATKLGKQLVKNLGTCRLKNKSLDLFCVEIENL